MDKKWIEDKMWSGHGWLSQTRTGIIFFNTEAVKCKHQEDIQQRSSLIYSDTEDYVEIKVKLEWFTKDKSTFFKIFFLQLW